MNPLVKKEIRLLLPAWIVAMLLAIFPIPIPIPIWTGWLIGTPQIGVPLAFALGFLLLGIASFGQELSSGSFTTLLAQPMERRRIWQVKTKILAYAFISVLFVWTVPREFYFILRLQENLYPNFPFVELESRLILFAITIFSGALWTTLLLRQIVPAFALTLLVPMSLMFWVGMLSDHYNWPNTVGIGVLIAYSIGGFFWARSMFLRAQDTQWTGGNVFFPWRGIISQSKTASISTRPRHWLAALVRKEIQLHQANILIAAILLLLNLSSVVVRKFHPHFKDPDMELILESIWLLWLLMPLLIGAAAIAEERRFGTLESQLCLPVSRRAQLFLKFFVALILSLFWGGAMPLLSQLAFNSSVFIFAAALFFVSFYASSLARTTLQALGLAVVVAVVIYFYSHFTYVNLSYAPFLFGQQERHGFILLKDYLCPPILLLSLSGLISWNFKSLHESRKLWLRNIIVLLAAFISISILIHAIFFRAWEFLAPLDPHHGPARLNAGAPPKFSIGNGMISAITPDGRLWSEQIQEQPIQLEDPNDFTRNTTESYLRSGAQQFIGGSNWVSAAWDGDRLAGIQSNGTLWGFTTLGHQAFPMARIGSDTDWLQIAGGGRCFLLLKNDGTLWLCTDAGPAKTLKQIGKGTNWVEVFPTPFDNTPTARKNDGSLWSVFFSSIKKHLTIGLFPISNTWLGNMPAIPYDGGFVKLGTNGDLLLSLAPPFSTQTKKGRLPTWTETPFARNAKWKAIGLGPASPFGNSLLAVRSDGTLWESKSSPLRVFIGRPGAFARQSQPVIQPVQLGNQSDWIALPPTSTYGDQSALALAADGSLWAWDEPSDDVWLAPSRKPIYMGNIFQATETTP